MPALDRDRWRLTCHPRPAAVLPLHPAAAGSAAVGAEASLLETAEAPTVAALRPATAAAGRGAARTACSVVAVERRPPRTAAGRGAVLAAVDRRSLEAAACSRSRQPSFLLTEGCRSRKSFCATLHFPGYIAQSLLIPVSMRRVLVTSTTRRSLLPRPRPSPPSP